MGFGAWPGRSEGLKRDFTINGGPSPSPVAGEDGDPTLKTFAVFVVFVVNRPSFPASGIASSLENGQALQKLKPQWQRNQG